MGRGFTNVLLPESFYAYLKPIPSKIVPFAESFDLDDKAEELWKKAQFAIRFMRLRRLSNGLLELQVDWTCGNSDMSYHFKYAKYDHRSSSYGGKDFPREEAFKMQFEDEELTYQWHTKENPDNKMDAHLSMEFGIQFDPERDGNYSFLFQEQTKWGLLAYFGPDGWDSSKGSEVLHVFDNDKELA